MSSRSSSVNLVVALAVACFSALIAIVLIAAGIAKAGGTSSSSAAPAATATTEPAAAPTHTPRPIPTQTPYEQLRGQLLAILEADGAQSAYELLKSASAAAPEAARLCPRVAADLARKAGPGLDWKAACP